MPQMYHVRQCTESPFFVSFSLSLQAVCLYATACIAATGHQLARVTTNARDIHHTYAACSTPQTHTHRATAMHTSTASRTNPCNTYKTWLSANRLLLTALYAAMPFASRLRWVHIVVEYIQWGECESISIFNNQAQNFATFLLLARES